MIKLRDSRLDEIVDYPPEPIPLSADLMMALVTSMSLWSAQLHRLSPAMFYRSSGQPKRTLALEGKNHRAYRCPISPAVAKHVAELRISYPNTKTIAIAAGSSKVDSKPMSVREIDRWLKIQFLERELNAYRGFRQRMVFRTMMARLYRALADGLSIAEAYSFMNDSERY